MLCQMLAAKVLVIWSQRVARFYCSLTALSPRLHLTERRLGAGGGDTIGY